MRWMPLTPAVITLAVINLAVINLAGCAQRVPAAGWARAQPLRDASPAVAWHDAAGRCTVATPLTRISCRAVLRRSAGGEVRLALLADEGVLLCDLSCDEKSVSTHCVIPDLLPLLPRLGWFVQQVWGKRPADEPALWVADHWLVATHAQVYQSKRLYGGDPLLLRQVTTTGMTINVGDYRNWDGAWLAYHSELSALGVAVTLQLNEPLP